MKGTIPGALIFGVLALVIPGTDAQAQVRSLSHCIVQASDNGISVSFRNVCNVTLHWHYVNDGGRPRFGGGSCRPSGGYTFGPGRGPVGLVQSGCGYRYWVCDMATWNRFGGRCH